MAWEVPNLNLGGGPRIGTNWADGILAARSDKMDRQRADAILSGRKQAIESARTPEGGVDWRKAVLGLYEAGDLQGAQSAAAMAQNETNDQWRRERAAVEDRQWAQSHALARENAGRGRQPNVIEIYNDQGMPQKGILGGDGSFTPIGGAKAPRTAAGLTSVDKKAILEADDAVSSGRAVISALERAERLNEKAYSGLGADSFSAAESVLPDWMVPDAISGGSKDRAVATQDLKNIVTAQALDQLKAVFGGMPTEGERKILLEIQGSVNQSPEVRAGIFARAKEAAQRRIEFNRRQAQGLRDGTYYTPDGATEPVTDAPVALQPQQQFREGQRAQNPATGQMIEFRNGQWVPVQ